MVYTMSVSIDGHMLNLIATDGSDLLTRQVDSVTLGRWDCVVLKLNRIKWYCIFFYILMHVSFVVLCGTSLATSSLVHLHTGVTAQFSHPTEL